MRPIGTGSSPQPSTVRGKRPKARPRPLPGFQQRGKPRLPALDLNQGPGAAPIDISGRPNGGHRDLAPAHTPGGALAGGGAGGAAALDPLLVQATDNPLTQMGVSGARARYEASVAGQGYQDAQFLKGAGLRVLGEGEDAGGQRTVKDPATGRMFVVDIAGNPYSGAAELMRRFQQRKRGDQNLAGSAGTLYDGSFGTEQRETQRAEGESWFGFGKGVEDHFLQSGANNQSAYFDALDAAFGSRLDGAMLDATEPLAKPPAKKPAAKKPAAKRAARGAVRAGVTAGLGAAQKVKPKRKGKK